jgi:hypothetical protein
VNFSLTVNASQASLVRFQIQSLQAGYRSLGLGVPDHPHYLAIRKAAVTTSDCTQNYACNVSTGNQGPSHATVALIISNQYQCTGTLLNNTATNGAAYILTARHCENGQLGGGDPEAAAAVTVYWDAVTPCGTPLGSIYDTATVSQSGATTALEQQDLWVIQLDALPVASDAYYAGWDASGAPFSGGYTIHHALGENQQYVAWSGTDELQQIPGATLSIAYASTFWGVVNGLGNIGAGGSGSALYSPTNQVVGSASLAQLTDGANTAGVCPVSPPPAPSPSTATALFTALSGAWTSTADSTSSTGSTTLKALLDPGGTGALTLPGIATQPITLTTSDAFADSGDLITLTWSAAGAASCTATGGSAGDGWSGVQPPSGSLQLTDLPGGTVTYVLHCLIGKAIGAASVTVGWDYFPPSVSLTGGSQSPITLGAATQLAWVANVQPCTTSGGVAGDGWAGVQGDIGSVNLTVTHLGLTQYTITCGTAGRTATSSLYIDGVEPSVTLTSAVSQITAGASVSLGWIGYGSGAPCMASGGSATDGWAQNNGSITQFGSDTVTESVAGTYTYTITCTGGGQTASSSQSVVVSPAPAAISLNAASAEKQVHSIGGPTAPTLDLLWSSTAGGNDCVIDYTNNAGLAQADVLQFEGTSGAVSDPETAPGVVTYTLQCGSLTASTTINWVSSAAAPALSAGNTTWAAGVAYPLTWNASAGPCLGSGGAAGDGWVGTKSSSGTQSVTEAQPGAYEFTLTCGSGAGATTSNVIVQVPPPGIQIYATPGSSPSTGLPYTSITWTASVGPCTYVDGSVPNSTGVAVAPTGSATPSPAVAGIYLFTLACGSGANVLRAATLASIPVNAPTTLTASATTSLVDGPITLTWNSANNAICYASGGDASAPWAGTLGGAGSGSLVVTSKSAGSVIYGINCNNETAQVTVTYTAVPATAPVVALPSVTLTSSESTETAGQSISLAWSSKNADSCSATGGTAGDGWTGTLSASGSMTVTEPSAGTVTYDITCAGAPPAATASTSVVIVKAAAPPPVTSPPSSSGGGGGGSTDPVLLLLLGLCVGVSVAREVRRSAPASRARRSTQES